MLWISFLSIISIAYLTTYAQEGYVVESLFISPFSSGSTAIIQDIINIEKNEIKVNLLGSNITDINLNNNSQNPPEYVFVFVSALTFITYAAISGIVAIDSDYSLEKAFAQETEEEQPTETVKEDGDQPTGDLTNSIATPADEIKTNPVQENTQNEGVLPETDTFVQCNEWEVVLNGICVSSSPTPSIEEPVGSGTEIIENATEDERGQDNNTGNTDENITNNGSTTDNNNSTQPLPGNNSTQTDVSQNNTESTNSTHTPVNNPPVAIATISKQQVCEGESYPGCIKQL